MVSRMTNSSSVPLRVVNRALVGISRQKRSLVLGCGVVAAMVAYLTFGVPTLASNTSTPAAAAPDCADAVMAAVIGHGTTAVQQQAYQCMDTSFQQRVSAQQFATQLQASGSSRGPITKVARVGTYDSPAGSTIVYYAVDTSSEQSLGFIVYLGQNGKVLTIE